MNKYHGQHGRGLLGNVLRGLGKVAIPMLKPVLRNVGHSLISKGMAALGDGKPLKRRRKRAGKSLKSKKRRKVDVLS